MIKTAFTIAKWVLWFIALLLLGLQLLLGAIYLASTVIFALACLIMFPLWDKLIKWSGFEALRLPVVLMLWLAGFCVMGGTNVKIDFDKEPEATVVESEFKFTGSVQGLRPTLKVNGVEVPLVDGRFEHVQPLRMGSNRIEFTLVAYTDEKNQTPHEEKKVFEINRVTPEALAWDKDTGSAKEKSESCSPSQNFITHSFHGQCEGTLRGLQKAVLLGFQDGRDDAGSYAGDPATTKVSLSTDKGRVRVSLRAPDGSVQEMTATPGSPVVLSGTTTTSSIPERLTRQLSNSDYGILVKVESLEGESDAISYKVEFDLKGK
jgi:hypothetical protein